MESFFTQALQFDIQGNIKEAIEYYKLSIEKDENIEEAYSNLLVLLLEINFDYGKSSDLIMKKIITENDIPILYNQYEDLLNKSIEKFPNTNEFIFWKYITDNFYNKFDRKTLLQIIETKEDSLVPYFHLYINDLANNVPFSHYFEKIIQLKKIVNDKKTGKNKYIKSLIDSAEANYFMVK